MASTSIRFIQICSFEINYLDRKYKNSQDVLKMNMYFRYLTAYLKKIYPLKYCVREKRRHTGFLPSILFRVLWFAKWVLKSFFCLTTISYRFEMCVNRKTSIPERSLSLTPEFVSKDCPTMVSSTGFAKWFHTFQTLQKDEIDFKMLKPPARKHSLKFSIRIQFCAKEIKLPQILNWIFLDGKWQIFGRWGILKFDKLDWYYVSLLGKIFV